MLHKDKFTGKQGCYYNTTQLESKLRYMVEPMLQILLDLTYQPIKPPRRAQKVDFNIPSACYRMNHVSLWIEGKAC